MTLTFDSSLYSSTLSTTSSTVACYVDSVLTTCTIANGVVTITLTSDIAANTTFTVTLTNVMNPTAGSSTITAAVVTGSTVVAYNSAVGPIET